MDSLILMRRIIEQHPSEEKSDFFRQLLNSIQGSEAISLSRLYDLDYRDFELALETLRDWRLQRYREQPASPAVQ